VQAVRRHPEARPVPVVEAATEFVVEAVRYMPVEGVEALDRPVADTVEVALNIQAEQVLVVAAPAEERAVIVRVVAADTAAVLLPKIDPNLFAVRLFSFAGKSAAAARMQDSVSDHCLDTAVLLADWAEHSCRSAPAEKFVDRFVDCLSRYRQGIVVAAVHTAVVAGKAPPAASPEHSELEDEVVVAEGVARQPQELVLVGHRPAESVPLVQGQAPRRSRLIGQAADLARRQDEQFSAASGPGCSPW